MGKMDIEGIEPWIRRVSEKIGFPYWYLYGHIITESSNQRWALGAVVARPLCIR